MVKERKLQNLENLFLKRCLAFRENVSKMFFHLSEALIRGKIEGRQKNKRPFDIVGELSVIIFACGGFLLMRPNLSNVTESNAYQKISSSTSEPSGPSIAGQKIIPSTSRSFSHKWGSMSRMQPNS